MFSDDKDKHDMRKYQKGEGQNLELAVTRFRAQCDKYCREFQLTKDRMFVLLPSWVLVHRKKSSRTIQDYEAAFLRNSDLSDHSLILLSSNLLLDLSSDRAQTAYEPTDRFEGFIRALQAPTGVKP